jgi:hypothetical protein
MNPVPSQFAPPRPLSPARISHRPTESGKHLPQPSDLLHPVQMRQPTPRKALFALPKEPEDARITGGTRSLDRRLLGLNLNGTRTRLTQSRPRLDGTHPTAA